MFFTLSKLAGSLMRPSAVMVALILLGLALLWAARRRPALARWGRLSLGLGLSIVLAASLTPVGRLALAALETRFPAADPTSPPPAGIVLLGGPTDVRAEAAIGAPKYLRGAEAVAETARLARRYPDVPIVLTGTGPHNADGVDHSEAASMMRLLEEYGIARDRMILERRARDTWENARFSHEMIRPAPGARWLLVTAAWHMPRSIGAFRAAGWDGILAHPTPGETATGDLWRPPVGYGFAVLDLAAKEWQGLIGYRLTGRSTALFPAP